MNREQAERLAASIMMIGFPGREIPETTRELIRRGVRAFVLFAQNCGSAEQIFRLTHDLTQLAGSDRLVAIDHEGGTVFRLHGAATQWPSAMAFGATGRPGLARQAAQCMGRELCALGININFAPVADVLSDTRNPVLSTRVYSDDPAVCARFVEATVQGLREGGVAATAKHFPGHGGTPTDSHVDLPVVNRDENGLRKNDLVPFEAAIAAGVDCLMLSHVWYPAFEPQPRPATMSARVVSLARDDLGFRGLVVTDCMEMSAVQRHYGMGEAAVSAVEAGCDLIIVSHRSDRQEETLEALSEALLTGRLDAAAVAQSSERLDALGKRFRCEVMNREFEGSEALLREVVERAVTVTRNGCSLLPLRPSTSPTLGLVTFSPKMISGVESNPIGGDLSHPLRRRGFDVMSIVVKRGGVSDLSQINQRAAVVVVVTSFATGCPEQAGIVDSLIDAGKQVIVVSARDPFDMALMPQVPCFLAAYGDDPSTLEAVAAVLCGEISPTGHLPVVIPAASGQAP